VGRSVTNPRPSLDSYLDPRDDIRGFESHLTRYTPTGLALREIGSALGPKSGLEAVTAHTRAGRFDAIAGEGLEQLDEISTLLVATAILAVAS
jgi:hypothetical protein